MCLQYKSFENTVGKGEIARHEQFLLFPHCFLPVRRTYFQFLQIWSCRLLTHSVWKSLRFVVWYRINRLLYTNTDNCLIREIVCLFDIQNLPEAESFQPCPDGSVISVSDPWPGGCEFGARLRPSFFPAYFRLSPLKHVRKVVGRFRKKVVLLLVWESQETHVRHRPP